MRKTLIQFSLLATAAMAAACSFAARSPEDYAKDTQTVLETKNAEIKACYDGILKTDSKAQGQVTVKFVVEPETGAISQANLDAAKTTAPTTVSNCVLQALPGLKLNPGDAREGIAAYTWDFQVGAAPAPAPAK